MNSQKESEIAKNLVSRILAGDKIAESKMVRRYDRGLRFMLRRRANGSAIADDIAQETWRIVIEKVRQGELIKPSKLSAFIVQIGKNQLLMHFRSSHSTRVTTEVDITEMADQSKRPQEILEQHNLSLIVRRLVSELKTKRDKDILIRFYLNEENKQSICESFDLSELHFNRVLFRARQRFKQLWDEYSRVTL